MKHSQHLFIFRYKLPHSANFCSTVFFSLLFINRSWVSLYLCVLHIISVYFLVIYRLYFCIHDVLKIIWITLCVGDYCILREETMRERRGSYSGCVVGCIPSFCWIIKRKDLAISLVDVAHTG
jgi:hypothetical protein